MNRIAGWTSARTDADASIMVEDQPAFVSPPMGMFQPWQRDLYRWAVGKAFEELAPSAWEFAFLPSAS